VDVDRVVVEVRVLDAAGRPVRGLDTGHFRLEVDGRAAPIESVLWVDQAPGAQEDAAAAEPEAGAPALPGRLLLLLFQKDLTSTRGVGLLRMQQHARDLIDRLGPRDRVAVASHDSRLRVWLDFTADRAAARRALSDSVLFGRALTAPDDAGPSLRTRVDAKSARDAASPEAAVKVLADALKGLPGTKTLVLFGWGMGRFGAGGVTMTPEYEPALAALTRAGVSVFTLDLTGADYHSLEVGLQQVARDTGGTYARTHLFPGQAVRQLEAALSGHYLLSFERPTSLPRGEHRIRVRLSGARGTVMARSKYVDPD
jgi:VWFA-related protein